MYTCVRKSQYGIYAQCASCLQGIKHYEPAVVTQLLEFLYRYVADILQDAQVAVFKSSALQLQHCCLTSDCSLRTWSFCKIHRHLSKCKGSADPQHLQKLTKSPLSYGLFCCRLLGVAAINRLDLRTSCWPCIHRRPTSLPGRHPKKQAYLSPIADIPS